MAAQGAAAAAPDMSEYITRVEAQQEIGRLVKEQLDTFQQQRDAIAEQSRQLEEQARQARETSGQLAIEVGRVLTANKAQCDEQIAQQVGKLRTDAQDAVTTVNEKIKEMEEIFKNAAHAQTVSQDDSELKLSEHV